MLRAVIGAIGEAAMHGDHVARQLVVGHDGRAVEFSGKEGDRALPGSTAAISASALNRSKSLSPRITGGG